MQIQQSILALTVLVTTAWAQNSCPHIFNGYKFENSQYFVAKIKDKSHAAAQKACWDTAPNAHLADVTGKHEHDFLKTLAKKHGCDVAWLGGFRDNGKSKNWYWKKRYRSYPYASHMYYQKWGKREPNNYKKTNENRLVLYGSKDYTFNDVPQTISKYVRGDTKNKLCYICECPSKCISSSFYTCPKDEI